MHRRDRRAGRSHPSAERSRCGWRTSASFRSRARGQRRVAHRRAGTARCGWHLMAGCGAADDDAQCDGVRQAPLARGRGGDPWLAFCIVPGSADRVEIYRAHEAPFTTGLESACFRPRKKIRLSYEMQVGTALPADWMRPARLDFTIRELRQKDQEPRFGFKIRE